MEKIRSVDRSTVAMSAFKKHLADCVVLTHDNKILLQYRPVSWPRSPNTVTLFGGHVEEGETPLQAVIRELAEEIGAKADEPEMVFIGTISESWTKHTELVHIYFWHDKKGTITGCYEAEPLAFNTITEALAHPRIMDYTRWALEECMHKNLIPFVL